MIQARDLFIYLFYFVTVTPLSVCHPNPCYNGGSCHETHSGYVCVCSENYGGPLCKGEAQSSYFNEQDRLTTWLHYKSYNLFVGFSFTKLCKWPAVREVRVFKRAVFNLAAYIDNNVCSRSGSYN